MVEVEVQQVHDPRDAAAQYRLERLGGEETDAEVAAWQERRTARLRAQAEAREQAADAAATPRRRRFGRRSPR
jgi:hypothetical protein